MAGPIRVSQIPNLTDLYQNGELRPTAEGSPPKNASSSLNSKISLLRADITKLATSCIVNAANSSLLGGGGVDGAIHSAAGPELLQECRTLGGCRTGSAKMTLAYDLPSSHVIHAVGPIYSHELRERGPNGPADMLKGCYRTSLDLCAAAEKVEGKNDERDTEGKSVAFSCLSTGVYGYPGGDACEIACKEVRSWLEKQEAQEARQEKAVGRVIFCCFLEKDMELYKEWLPKVFPPATKEQKDTSDLNKSGNTADPPVKRQKKDPSASQDLDSSEWEAVEKPGSSLASSTISTADTITSDTDVIKVDSANIGAHTSSLKDAEIEQVQDREKQEPLDSEGVKVEATNLAEEEGVEVEKPDDEDEEEVSTGNTQQMQNMLGKDW